QVDEVPDEVVVGGARLQGGAGQSAAVGGGVGDGCAGDRDGVECDVVLAAALADDAVGGGAAHRAGPGDVAGHGAVGRGAGDEAGDGGGDVTLDDVLLQRGAGRVGHEDRCGPAAGDDGVDVVAVDHGAVGGDGHECGGCRGLRGVDG